MKFKKGIIIAISSVVLVAVIVVVALSLAFCGGRAVDVKSAYFLDLSFSGFNGHATADISVDSHNINVELAKYKEDVNYYQIKRLFNSISFSMETPALNGKFKNGDTFNVVATYNEGLAKELNFVFKNTNIKCTVKSLKEGVALDAFKNLKVTFEGKNGSGYANIDTSDCESLVKSNVTFDIDYDSNKSLSNGDKIKVKATAYGSLEKEGYFLKQKTKEYTVTGLVGPVSSLDGVDTTKLRASMQSELNSKLKSSYTVEDWDYQFESGKKRDISSYNFTYTTESEVVNYEYIYAPDNLSDNALIAYYKVTVTFKAKRDQSYVADGCEKMKKDETDKGVTYVAIVSDDIEVTSDKKINENKYMYFSVKNGKDIATIREEANIEGLYSSEYFDSKFKKTNKLHEDEKPTEAPTEKPTEKPTEAPTEKSTEAPTKSSEVVPTEKPTSDIATEVVTDKTTEKATENTTKN